MGSVVDYNTFSTLSLLKSSVKWYKDHNQEGKFDHAIEIEETAFKEHLKQARG